MRSALFALALVVTTSSASAMGATLTDLPATRTGDTCQRWAAAQDEDALAQWGLLESGKNSDDVAKLRLALSCLGDRAPEIVNFSTSVGAAEHFCRTRRRVAVCRNVR